MSSSDDLDFSNAQCGLSNADIPTQSGLFPLSAAQRGIWFAQHLLDDVPIAISQYVEFTDLDLDVDLLVESALIATRELGTGMLRIVERDGEPYQLIDESLRPEWIHRDFRSEEDPCAAAHAWMRAECSTPIDLLRDRLICSATLRLADNHYYLYSRIHHIALDGFGAMTFMNRTAELYAARVEGRDPARFRANSLREIVEDEHRYRTSSRFEKDRQYWSERSHDFPDPISLAGWSASPRLPARVISAPFPCATEVSVQRLLARQPGSMFATVAVAAVAAFLSRLTGEDDVVLSLPVSARTTARLRNSGGMVANVVPIRLPVRDETTVADLMRSAQLELTGALRHQRYRHEDIRRDAGIGGGHRGLFGPSINIMLFENEFRVGDSVGRFNVLGTGPVEDLTVNLYPSITGQVAQIDFEANPNLYTEEQLRGHHTRFLQFLAVFADAPADRRIGDLAILNEDEVAHLVPAGGPEPEPVRLLPDLLAEGVAAAPEGIAIRASGTEITYRDLDARSNRLARLLIAHGAGPETYVALCLPRSTESLLAFWAVAKAGAAVVPIDPNLPTDLIAHILTDSGALVGIALAELVVDLPDTTHWITLDTEATIRQCARLTDAQIMDAERTSVLRPDNTAYMIHSSGSTGVPKGVLVTHAGLANSAAAARPELGVTAHSRVLCFSSASFDASLFEMIPAFSAGATMVVVPPEVRGGNELNDLLRNEMVTHIISAATAPNTVDPRALVHLETVVVGADLCTPDLIDRFGVVCRFTNSYGPTEMTIVATVGEPLSPGSPITIGQPVQGVSAVVLDRRLQPVPVGVVGELYLAGPGLARGYHDGRGLTAEQFVANPFGEPGQRLYRSGDEARWVRPPGAEGYSLELIGRSDYWTGALVGLPDVLGLPTDRPRPAVRSGAGGCVEFVVSAVTAGRVQSWAQERGATAFMVVHAALSVVLAKLSGSTDIAVGSAVAGRGEAALDDLVGRFVNTVVLRVECDPDLSFTELVERVRERDLEAFAHADMPFERLVERLNPVRSQSFSPLFQVMLAFQNYAQSRVELPGLTVSPVQADWAAVPLDLSMSVGEANDGGYEGTLEYATDIFDPGTAAQIGERFVRVLEAVVDDPSILVRDVSVLGASERASVLDTWNDSGRVVPERLLLDGFAEQVVRAPDAVAVVFEGESLTYAQFDARVNRLARYLIDAGVGPESLVAVGMRRSLDMVIVQYAVVEAGGGYVPIDPNQPRERNDHVLEMADSVLVLTTAADRGVLPVGSEIVEVDGLDVSGYSSAPVTDTDRRAPLRPENVAYVLFTSGSTGRPKGVAVSHRAIANQLSWMVSEYGFTDSDVVVSKIPVTFDASLLELFLPLTVGARLVIARSDGHRNPEYLLSLIEDAGVTVAAFVPSMLGTLLADPAVQIPASLRLVYVGGEELPAELFGRLAAKSDARLDNMYGPTEAAVTVTSYRCDDRDVATVPIGAPVWNTQTYALDARLHPVAVGVAGELYLGGVQLSRGYQGRADLTAERFVADPFGDPGTRLYRTGDLVRWNRDGNLEFLGRTDFQVKVRGLRIELGEIESALVAEDAVSQAVAAVHENDLGQQLVGYVVPESGQSVDTEAVREAVGRSLPAYMVPAVLMVLDEFPLTPSGKVDRKALPAPRWKSREFRAPTTTVQEIVAGVFAEVLGVQRVGLDDDFFALGGNSLIATRVMARVGAALDARVPVRVIFEAPTVEALAVRVERYAGEGGRPVLEASPRPDRVPLSLAQQRMWFLNQFDPESAVYNIPVAIRLSGDLDVAALDAAVADVLVRHEALRTVFPDSEQGPSQVVVPVSRVPVDLTPVPVTAEEADERIAALVGFGFDVTAEVPVRGALLRFSESEYVLAMVAHHICADGLSTAPMARDVMVAYAARRAGREPGWAPLPVQYADYTLWQRELLGSEDDPESLASRQIDYWTGALAGLPDVLGLPTDRPRPAVRSGGGGCVEFVVSAATVGRVQAWAQDRGVTPFIMLHAVLSVVLAKLSGSTDIAVGSAVAGRGEAALDDLVGMFVNTVVLRVECDPDLSFTELVDRVRERDLEAFAHADVPFERLVEKLNPTRSQSFSPLFQVMLAFQNYTPSAVELPGLTVSPVQVEWTAAPFDLSMTFGEAADGGYEGSLVYATDIFDAGTAAQIGERFVRVLEAVVNDPSVLVGDVSVLDASERASVLDAWNDTGQPVPEGLLLDGFAEQVARTPDAVAVAFEGQSLTYAQFDARVNRLARLLIDAGVGPESLVAVGMRRSLEMVVGIYAVLRAGGGYVPIDPDQPGERIDYVLDTAAPVCVLSTSQDGVAVSGHPVVNIDAVDVSGYSAARVTESELLGPVRPENTAYVIFTSGSTGRPKGVAVSHRAGVNQLSWMIAEYAFTDSDAMVQKTPVTFDPSVLELFLPLAIGARLVIARPDGHRDPEYLLSLIADEGVTATVFVPSVLGTLLADPEVRIPESLRLVYVGGEELSAELFGRLAAKSDARLDNMYGPTEAAVTVTSYRCENQDLPTVPIGAPVWNTRSYVLDARLQSVPPGVAGELYLGGVQVARGYQGRADLTAERFVADPFGGPGARLYRTGDLVRWSREGNLEFLGRTDFQVKVRGLRIELGEIESALTALDEVAQAVVVVHEGDVGRQLVGYVVPAAGCTVEVEALREAAGRSLPAYMVPDALMVLDEFPLGPSEKVDRKALPAPVWAPREFRAPTTPVQQIVAGVFADVLGVERVGLDDDFFALGGNSLAATRVTSRLGSELDMTVQLQWLFSDPTVEALAGRIVAGVEGAAGEGFSSVLPIRESGAATPLFCIHPIVGLSWCYAGLAQRLDGDVPIYGVQSPALVDEGFVPESLEELAERYTSEIRAVQPAGPYRLLGWSLGGVIAHAMAIQLQAVGERVELLAMMDSFVGSTGAGDGSLKSITMSDLLGGFGEEQGVAGSTLSDLSVEAVTTELAGLTGQSVERAEQVVGRILSTAERNSRLMFEYCPERFDGDIVFFTAMADDHTGSRAAREWDGAVTGQVHNHPVPATHWRMTAPGALAVECPILSDVMGDGKRPE
ncbi:amino acid adenylation domain-containing protein [Rhodococcus sp. NPDC049939]|uniref:amino acid adenylation domain-containing protein n=1 Tax=Rhodococcus sp. NPDC049939 TaxID=3155511 RepID=UPI0033D12C11